MNNYVSVHKRIFDSRIKIKDTCQFGYSDSLNWFVQMDWPFFRLWRQAFLYLELEQIHLVFVTYQYAIWWNLLNILNPKILTFDQRIILLFCTLSLFKFWWRFILTFSLYSWSFFAFHRQGTLSAGIMLTLYLRKVSRFLIWLLRIDCLVFLFLGLITL